MTKNQELQLWIERTLDEFRKSAEVAFKQYLEEHYPDYSANVRIKIESNSFVSFEPRGPRGPKGPPTAA